MDWMLHAWDYMAIFLPATSLILNSLVALGGRRILSDPVWKIISLADNTDMAFHWHSYMGHGGRRPTIWEAMETTSNECYRAVCV